MTESKVELYSATLPGIIGLFAAHYWLVTHDETGCHRIEVWQQPSVRGTHFGHVHYDLMLPTAHVGGGPSVRVASWYGQDAKNILGVLHNVASYPHCDKYRPWPGPNSNTFVAWVLKKAGITYSLGWNALGKRFKV